MNKRSAAKGLYSAKAKEAVARGRAIQANIDRRDSGAKRKSRSDNAMQVGQRQYPSKFPPQHLTKPGNEADLKIRPMFEAPAYQGSQKLKDYVAIVTGGDSGIGRAVAVLYAREGADVAIVYLDEHDDAEETKRAVEAEGQRCITVAGDVADAKFCEDVVSEVIKKFGKLDVLVNNAAFQQHATFEELTEIVRSYDQDQSLRLFPHGQSRRATHEARRFDRHDRIGHRTARQQGLARLFDDQRRHSRFCAVAGDASG